MDPRLFPACAPDAPILDLGSGIGFWLEHFGELGFSNLTGADISPRSLELARQRCALHGIKAIFSEQNAEALTFPDCSFDHIQSLGVIHHSPNPPASVAEIFRTLKPGGRAVVSLYYKNFPLRHWRAIRPIGVVASRLGLSPRGRGRDTMMQEAADADDLVRLYDGADNPVGFAYSRAEVRAMFSAFRMVDLFTYTFPARLLPFQLPRPVFKALEVICPFMICAVTERPKD